MSHSKTHYSVELNKHFISLPASFTGCNPQFKKKECEFDNPKKRDKEQTLPYLKAHAASELKTKEEI